MLSKFSLSNNRCKKKVGGKNRKLYIEFSDSEKTYESVNRSRIFEGALRMCVVTGGLSNGGSEELLEWQCGMRESKIAASVIDSVQRLELARRGMCTVPLAV